jgi:hypothetical protein
MTPAAELTADLAVASVYGAAMAKTARRASDTVLRNRQLSRWIAQTQLPSPKAEEFIEDFLRDFDRLAIVAERIRASRDAYPFNADYAVEVAA